MTHTSEVVSSAAPAVPEVPSASAHEHEHEYEREYEDEYEPEPERAAERPSVVIRSVYIPEDTSVARESRDLQAITDIYNASVLEGGATADYDPRTLEQRAEWVRAHEPRALYPVVVLEVTDPHSSPTSHIAGFASLSPFSDRAGYEGIVEVSYYIHPRWRGHGFGTRLLGLLDAAAAERGHRMLVSRIFAGNAGSIALMKRYNYTQYGLLPRASWDERHQTWHDVTYWYKTVESE